MGQNKVVQFEIWSECNNVCPFCLTPDTKVLMGDFSVKNISDVQIGESIIGFTEFNTYPRFGKRVYQKGNIQKISKRYIDEDIFVINNELNITKNHPILTNRSTYLTPEQLLNRKEQIYKTELPMILNSNFDINFKIGYIVGCWLGDGSYKEYHQKRNTYKCRFAVNDEEITERLAIFMDDLNIKYYFKQYNMKGKKGLVKAIFANTFTVYNKIKCLIEKNVGINNSENYIQGFLSGIFDCEGTNCKNNLSITNTDIYIVDEIKRCLAYKNIFYHMQIEKQLYHKTTYRFRIYRKFNKTFIESINPACKRKIYKLNHVRIGKKIKPNFNKIHYKGYVYNLQTSVNTYIANGYLVHNCYLRKQMKVLTNEQKAARIQTIIDYVSDDEKMREHDGVAIIGGEIFQGQLADPGVKSKWIELMQIVNKREEKEEINNFWVASALLREDLTDCFDTIDCFTDKSKVLLCTSYDTVGRFINEEQKQLWFKNVGIIREKYPDIKLHSQIVCTQHFIEDVLNETFKIEEVRQKYKMRIDLSDPWVGYYYKTKQEFEEKNPNFFPRRKDFIKFIRYLHNNTTMNLEWLFSGEWFAETLFTEVEGELKMITDRHLRQSDLPLDIADKSGYIDSDINMRDDVLKMLEAWKRKDD